MLYLHKTNKWAVLLILLLMSTLANAVEYADKVLVEKSTETLLLLKNGRVLKKFHVSFGAHPKGHKRQQGDERTPEGKYILDYKNAHSKFYKSIHISYPNKTDRERARKAHVNPGGDIMIHGQKNGLGWLSLVSQRFNWTDGCIAVTNDEMDEIWKAVKPGTPIEIRP